MKKYLALFLAVLMIGCVFAACNKNDKADEKKKEETILGTYKGSNDSYGDITLVLENEGKGKITLFGSEMDIDWEQTGNKVEIVFEGDAYTAEVKDGNIILDGVTLEKQK